MGKWKKPSSNKRDPTYSPISLTVFKVYSVRYAPSFFHLDLWLAHFALGPKNKHPITYSTDQEDEASKIFIRSLLCF